MPLGDRSTRNGGWQLLTDDGIAMTDRLRVPGGWIVRSRLMTDGVQGFISHAVHQVFIPDPQHEWRVS